uniref:histidine--tRNA ligase n=1 Tax=Palpitomonas bilix TaxID=652834 RepID=A0A7S3GLE9_9EUKA|mmetsp:Transcript_8591/g.23049  ORF Transcript_8591/g.23049 Transcript_8591/m.23049 type:complete len:472 (+) Transcript_8591:333-1748(+)|eukprot:CAMPEP_0113891276 /NCGR_PEP_ID=MMETSP0780_2-20120614/14662_1 /TAXON_ID=652834 /ORGANISM="Palpitomonas bilix" /LENGTH=471 /DNA_ID=CAMNT_0000880867 /DNA_START=848 /DNA_END=2263 /DNA_ORIENTATION=- /assembly_acc=CAM_ASM_000599
MAGRSLAIRTFSSSARLCKRVECPPPVKGTFDLVGTTAREHSFVRNTAERVFNQYGFREITTPILERRELFVRSLGDGSDVVTKEMYQVKDKSDGDLVMRPEGTASVVRSLLSSGEIHHLPQRLFYFGPMFRYESPQKGRYRQFHQLGVEAIGYTSLQTEVELIIAAKAILQQLGISQFSLQLNTIGTTADREGYKKKLESHFERHRHALSEDSVRRLETGAVLRILDSKARGDKAAIHAAPTILDSLSTASRHRFDTVCDSLTREGIEFEVNPRIVRGLDYYNDTVFEYLDETRAGQQTALLGGGRYDGLVESLGGPSTPAFGWAAGVERLRLALDQSLLQEDVNFAVVPLLFGQSKLKESSAIEMATSFQFLSALRQHGLHAFLEQPQGAAQKALRRCSRAGASAAFLLGEDECAAGLVMVKSLRKGEAWQVQVPLAEAPTFVQSLQKGWMAGKEFDQLQVEGILASQL